jgi:hypothetical protein
METADAICDCPLAGRICILAEDAEPLDKSDLVLWTDGQLYEHDDGPVLRRGQNTVWKPGSCWRGWFGSLTRAEKYGRGAFPMPASSIGLRASDYPIGGLR